MRLLFHLAVFAAFALAAAGCADLPKGPGADRAHAATAAATVGMGLDQRATGDRGGATLLAFGIATDYYFHDNFALGARYQAALNVSNEERQVDYHEVVADFKVQGDLAGFKPYAHLGGGWLLSVTSRESTGASSSHNHWAFEWGAGFDIYVTEDWAFTLDATMTHSNTTAFGEDDGWLFQSLFGVKYKF